MAGFQTINVPGNSPVPLIFAGDGPTLINNSDPDNTIWLGADTGLNLLRSTVVPLAPGSWLALDGLDDVYGICATGETAACYVIPGGMNFFLLSIIEQLILSEIGQGVFVYDGTPALGNLVVSIAPQAGTDKYGNTYPQGLFVSEGVFEGEDYIINTAGAFFYSSTPSGDYGSGWVTF